MVRALLDGKKTQTRRVLRNVPVPPDTFNLAHAARHPWPYLDAYCSAKKTPDNPRGMGENWCWWTRDDRAGEQFRVGYKPGDRLWVRENAVIAPRGWTTSPANPMGPFAQEVGYLAGPHAEGTGEAASDYGLETTPSIFMPRWASRLTLTVTDVRVQRLQEITEQDAVAEGVETLPEPDFGGWWGGASELVKAIRQDPSKPPSRIKFAWLWNHLGGHPRRRWADDPWIVALTFTVAQHNIDSPHAAREAE